MNLLAHVFLSGNCQQVMFGNLITDFLKGEVSLHFPTKVRQGILLHREIDCFTDRHSQVRKSKRLLWQNHRHYSSVIVDIFYDHFLARHWQEYNKVQSIEDFAGDVYATIRRFDILLPKKAKEIFPHMIANDWLVNYGDIEGINKALQGVAKRASFQSNMGKAVEDLLKDYKYFENDFRIFFPELMKHSELHLNGL